MINTEDKLKDETPHFGNTLLGAVPVSECFNEDCVEGLKRFSDGFFDLAIVDPPYGSNIMAKNKFQRHKTKDTTYRNKSIQVRSIMSSYTG